MIEINFLDANGSIIHTLTTIEEVQNFFNPTVNCSTPQTLVLDLVSNHNKYIMFGIE